VSLLFATHESRLNGGESLPARRVVEYEGPAGDMSLAHTRAPAYHISICTAGRFDGEMLSLTSDRSLLAAKTENNLPAGEVAWIFVAAFNMRK
jgi:hypothetical protein